jgi:hypothetical protein
MTRYLAVLFFCFLFNKGISQDSAAVCDSQRLTSVKAYFEGYSYKYEDLGTEIFKMERSYFKKNFRLSLSDSSYRVVKFSLVTDLANGDLLEIVGDKDGIKFDKSDYTKLLSKMTKHSLVAIDNIIVSKNEQCYRLAAFVCYMLN